jgi:starch-binding outer membrane protein SusE/F
LIKVNTEVDMKKTLILLILSAAVFFTACEKDKENVMLKETIESNELSNLTASSFVLTLENADNVFQTFTWDSIDYGFDAVVTYTVQADKTSNNFSSPIEVAVVTNAKTAEITVGEFNRILLNAGYETDVAALMQFRVKSTIHPAVAPVYSNSVEATVTPYATTFPPIFMTGAATGGWSWDMYVYKELRSTAPNVYQTIGYFLNGEAFRFFKQADWNPDSWNYPYFTGTVSALFENAADGDQNFRFIGATGYYTVTVNMTTKSVSMEPVAEPVLYMTGAAVGGWNWDTDYVQMTWKSNGIFEATTDFIQNETFRFFGQAGWGPTGYNYPYFADGTVTALLENALDGDSNFKFLGATGSYKVTVNMLDLVITMVAQ